ncbi:uncharacterized protein LOC131317000 [Rhododendron vialii]|uniref:uncharacterized protein LOC131317000 n=1 Tax=Rhododendron vialii TaxID=182163 RepID=UPI00265E7E94|nr:uncharacterized protein LOC131317000 [Rhododendron vialii]
MTRFLPFAIVVALHLVCMQTLCAQQGALTVLFQARVVHIFSALPNTSPLNVRCLAKGDDRGTYTLNYSQELYWQFNPYNTSGNPIYFCRFNWGSKQKTLVVYDIELDPLCKHNDIYECYWFVASNGFYFSNDAMDYRRRAGWA